MQRRITVLCGLYVRLKRGVIMSKTVDGWSADPVQLIAFDFDGTITTKDTFALFLRYYAGTPVWALKIASLLHVFAAYGLKLIDRTAVKRRVIRRFFKGKREADVMDSAAKFARDVIPQFVRPAALAEVKAKLLRGEAVALVSASINPYLDVWAESVGVPKVIATRLKSESGFLTGELDGVNCWGEGKLSAIKAEMGRKKYEIAEAYGDTDGDKPMLIAAKASFYRPFRV